MATPSKLGTITHSLPRHFATLRSDDMAAHIDTTYGPAYRCIERDCERMASGTEHHAHTKRAYLVWRNPKRKGQY